ncbi:MAG: site-2 protease family protein [Anaerolineae bacterium]|nr:site-2 protease family protein [Anaerolineae bacterium]
MHRQAIPLGRIFGISIGLDYSWFLIFGLLTWTLAVSYYPGEFENWPAAQYWVVGAVTALMLFVSVLLHELGHSVIALRYKIPVRSITLFVFGGVAQIGGEPPSAAAEFWIAIAGPMVSLILAVFFGLLRAVVSGIAPLLALAKYLAYMNGSLFLFNLIPGFPLDGGRVFRALVWGVSHSLRRATLIAANLGRGIAYLFIFTGVWQILGGNFGNGLWIAFIGWFLESAAVAQVQQQRIQDLLAGHTVSQAMSRNYAAIPAETPLQQLVDHHILGSGQRSFVVKRGNEVVGLLTLHHLKKVPSEQWPTTTAARAMLPLEQIKSVQPSTDLWAALEKMDRDGVNQLLVRADGQIVGMLSREDFISFLRTLQTLKA